MSAGPTVAAIGLVSVLISACGGGGSATCTEVRETEDPLSGTHVIAGTEVTFPDEGWPPTSGPHVALPAPEGVLTEPLDPTMQVRILESGAALIQYDAVEIADRDTSRAEVEALAGDGVVVAPGEHLPAPIVATAWTWKLTCSELDVDAVEEFAATRPQGAPGAD